MSLMRGPRVLAANAARIARLASARSAIPGDGRVWIVLPVGPAMGEFRIHRRIGPPPPLGLLEMLRLLEAAAEDERVDGVLLDWKGGVRGWSHALALGRAITRARERGLRVAVWADSLDAQDYLVAAAADRIWLPASGSLGLVGLQVEQLFLRELLSNLDVEAEVVHVGRYKSAGEMLTRDAMSAEQREQLGAWQDDLFDALVGAIAGGRGLSPESVRDLVDRGPYSAAAAVEAGLVDELSYRDEVGRAIELLQPVPPDDRPGPRRPRFVDADVYLALHVDDAGFRSFAIDTPAIAYVAADGSIQRGMGRRGIQSETFRLLLDGLAERSDVRGVVLRIDSPGGDAVASDLLYRAVEQLRREKPVVASMGDVAASGGYYMAAAADQVLAEAGTLTGSIGVVGGKLNLSGLYRRLGIAKDGVERGARAGMLSEVRGFTPDERSAVRREMESMYETFLDRVESGRGLQRADLERVAHGRVWSGLRATTLGLVDAVGGPLEAIGEACRRAGLRTDERFRLETHPRGLVWPSIADLVGGGLRIASRRPRSQP